MPYPYKKMTEEDFAYIRSVTSEDRVWVGDEIAREFYRDEMPGYGVFPPELYVEVENRDEVSAIMKYAYENNIPVVCRGAGTGLAGGATCKYGGIMLSVMRMNRIFPVDHKNQTITCEPGALLLDVQAAAAAEGLFYPPDPGEKTASIGGNVITNAGGMKAVRYGLTRDFVRCIEAVLPDGSIMNFSSNVVKNTTGYDIKDLVIGSEGTLCILTQVTLKLLPAPTCSCTLVMPFGSLEECADMVPEVLALPFIPTAIEFLERELIDIVERNLGKLLPVRQGEAVLIVMYDASSRQELDSAVEAAAEAALAHGAIDCCIANTPERAASVWAVRGGILEGMKADSVAQEECDVVVPRACIAEYVKAAKRIALSHGIRVEPCGHCGDGNIHTEMLRGPEMSDEEWKSATHASLTELYALSKKLGGQLSGEHGIGNGRLEFLEEFVGERMIRLYKSIKLAFDDRLILNPGKVIDFNGTKVTYPEVRLVMWAGGNPFAHQPDTMKLERAWKKPETVVVTDTVWTATARHADIVLPAATVFEHNDITNIGTYSNDGLVAMQQAIEPQWESKPDYWIFSELAKRMGLEAAYTEGLDEMGWIKRLYGESQKMGERIGVKLPAFEEFWKKGYFLFDVAEKDRNFVAYEAFRKDPKANSLATESGLIQLYSPKIASYGYKDCLGHPAYFVPTEGVNTKTKAHPLALMACKSRYRMHSQLDGTVSHQFANINDREPCWINPADAKARGLKSGDVALVKNDRGALLAGVYVTDRVQSGVVVVHHGAWFAPLDIDGLRVDVHGNSNTLTMDEPTSSLACGNIASTALVEVEKWTKALPRVYVYDQPESVLQA